MSVGTVVPGDGVGSPQARAVVAQVLEEQAPVKKQLSAEDILETDDLELKEVVVPEWKGTVFLRVMPADEGLALNEKMQALSKEKATEAIFMLLAACLVDAEGKRLFTTEAHLARLRTRSQKVLVRLQKAALTLQGWLDEAPSKNA